jgi:hypothetical protein
VRGFRGSEWPVRQHVFALPGPGKGATGFRSWWLLPHTTRTQPPLQRTLHASGHSNHVFLQTELLRTAHSTPPQPFLTEKRPFFAFCPLTPTHQMPRKRHDALQALQLRHMDQGSPHEPVSLAARAFVSRTGCVNTSHAYPLPPPPNTHHACCSTKETRPHASYPLNFLLHI